MTEKEKNIKSDTVKREEAILEFWKENETFEKSLKQTEKGKEFIFYEGPPTANGRPGIHHLEARAFKDVIPRYKTMRGYHVRRKSGWDTHGLPVELQVEKKLGLNSKKGIEEYGIAKFNQECKTSVWEYLDVWNKFTTRIGFWLDQEDPYITYRNNYIESVWNVIKKVDDQKLLYKDYKVVPWCPRCGTVLSSHELAQGYEDVKDLSVYVKFKVKGQGNTYILAWTTTPWTLPGNVALAVGEEIIYVKVKVGDEIFILAKERLSILSESYEILAETKGKDLIDLEYEPLFPYLAEIVPKSEKPKIEKAYKVYGADFVTTIDGTGIVHTAVMYGQDDFELGTKIGLPKHHLVNPEGKFISGTGFLAGRFVKEKDGNGKPTLEVDIIQYLTDKNLFFKKENYEHSYPHCWRCKTALIYYARDSWYIRMSDKRIKEKLIAENKKINWEPSHIGEGRFGEWLREIKDWAISRERYWGTPLPVWICESCKKIDVIGSIEDLKNKTKKSGNKYFVMRHGEAESNLSDKISCHVEDPDHLTENGKKQILDSVEELKNKKINLIISSDFIRTRETGSIVMEKLELPESNLIFDKRIREFNVGIFNGETWSKYYASREEKSWYFFTSPGGESCKDMKFRTTDFLYDIEKKYKNKNILILTHEGPARMLFVGKNGLNDDKISKIQRSNFAEIKYGKILKIDFAPLPHNENFELDLHRPYIDEITLMCSCGGNLARTKEVMDVWLDSGAMPFAQDHYPFDPEPKQAWYGVGNKNPQKILYPADFICEAIDQTRGWFYTLHAVGILMGRGKAYKNVICLGHLLDALGKKMSKSTGNVVDPWAMMEKYGVDTLRLWMYSVNQPGESKNFDEKTVLLLHQQVFGLLYNVLAFYELYPAPEQTRYGASREKPKSKNVLDQWILARLDEIIGLATKNLDNYKLLEPTRAIKDFVGDLSTWYLRRSRERIKNGDISAKQTLYYVLKTLTKLMAPFAPFTAEDIWQKLKTDNDKESVHLTDWPEKTLYKKIKSFFNKGKTKKIIKEMTKAREAVTEGLELRQKAKIQVRQPVSRISSTVAMPSGLGLYKIIKDELNAKEILFDQPSKDIDTNITSELKEEGNYRQLVRALQDTRKKIGLTPIDRVRITFDTDDTGERLIKKFEADLKDSVLISEIEFGKNDGEEIEVSDSTFGVKIDKI